MLLAWTSSCILITPREFVANDDSGSSYSKIYIWYIKVRVRDLHFEEFCLFTSILFVERKRESERDQEQERMRERKKKKSLSSSFIPHMPTITRAGSRQN